MIAKTPIRNIGSLWGLPARQGPRDGTVKSKSRATRGKVNRPAKATRRTAKRKFREILRDRPRKPQVKKEQGKKRETARRQGKGLHKGTRLPGEDAVLFRET